MSRRTSGRRETSRAQGGRSWVRSVIGVTGELLLTAGALVLLFAVWQVWWTDVEANAVHAESVTQLEHQFTSSVPTTAPTTPPKKDEPAAPKALDGSAFAIARIPSLGAKYAVPIVEGTAKDDLERGIGHYSGTARPGQIGNLALAGHRMTYGGPFRDIERVRPGDVVIIETATDFYVYTMGSHTIVDPSHIAAIAPVPEHPGVKPTVASITLTACHPKYAATWRWIVHGKLTETIPRADWDPARFDLSGGA